jgi:hypothetical protein
LRRLRVRSNITPNKSFKPNPHRGVAWVLFRYASTQSPPRYGFGLNELLGPICGACKSVLIKVEPYHLSKKLSVPPCLIR